MPRTLGEAAEAAAAGGPAPPPLVVVTPGAAPLPQLSHLFMVTDSQAGGSRSTCRFLAPDGSLTFKVEAKCGLFSGSKTVSDGQGRVLLTAKQVPLSRAKWKLSAPDGRLLAKTQTIGGMARIGVEATFPGRAQCVVAAPNVNDLSRMVMWQASSSRAKEAEEAPLCEAAYGQPTMGFVSAFVNDWSYSIALAPGADAALACALLCVYTDLTAYNAGMALFSA